MEKLEPPCTAGGNIKVQPLWESVWQFLKGFNIDLLYHPATSLPDTVYPREIKVCPRKNDYECS